MREKIQMISTGCTGENRFSLPCGEEEIAVMYITYQQDEETVLEKTKADCVFEGKTACVPLSQEDSLKFDPEAEILIQVRVRTTDGQAMKSDIMRAAADRLLKDGVI